MTRQPPRWFEQQARYLQQQANLNDSSNIHKGVSSTSQKPLRPCIQTVQQQWREKQTDSGSLGKPMFRRLESLEEELSGSMSYTGSARWMIPYADMLTVLIGLFLVMLAVFHADNQQLSQANQTMTNSLNATEAQLLAQQKELDTLKNSIQRIDVTASPEGIPEPEEPEAYGLLASGLKQPNDTLPIEVTQSERGLIIRMMDRVLFSPGSAELSPQAKHTLNQVAEILKPLNRPIAVEGHTDTTPIATSQYPSNWELSTARATTIIRYFITAHHFEPSQLSASGYGQYQPIAQNSTIQGKQKNRRVDIVIMGKLAEKVTESRPASLGPPSPPERPIERRVEKTRQTDDAAKA